jgi:hypothetical protein
MEQVAPLVEVDPFLQMGSTNDPELQGVASNLKRKLLRVLQAF